MERSRIPYFVLIAFLLVLGFLPATRQTYAFHDDFSYWLFPHHQMPQPQAWVNSNYGRYLGALVCQINNLFVKNVRDLNTIRLMDVAVIIVCAIMLFEFLMKFMARTLDAALMAVIVFSLPAFEVMADWAIAMPIALAVLFAMLSFSMADRIPMEGGTIRRLINPFSLAAVSLMVIAHLFYPPSATFFWAMAGIGLLGFQSHTWPLLQKKAGNLYGVGLIGIALYFGLFKLISHFIFFRGESLNTYRSQEFTSSLTGKFSWFCHDVLPQILSLWGIFPEKILPVIVSAVILGALILKLKEKAGSLEPSKVLCQTGMIFSLVILSYLPNLLAVVDLNVYRCTAGIMTLAVTALLWSISTYCACLLPKPVNSYFFTAITGLICAFGVHQSNFNIDKFRASPSHLEYMYMKTSIQEFTQKLDTLVILAPDPKDYYYSIDEFGAWIPAGDDDIISMINCVFDEIGQENGWEWIGPRVTGSETGTLEYIFEEKTLHGTSYHIIPRFQIIFIKSIPKKDLPRSMLFINMKTPLIRFSKTFNPA